MSAEPLSTSSEWSFELLESYHTEIARIASNFGLDTYRNQIEIINSEQMLDAYSSVGLSKFLISLPKRNLSSNSGSSLNVPVIASIQFSFG